MNSDHRRHAATVGPCADDPYASVWRLCRNPSFRLPQSPPRALSSFRCVEYCPFGPIPLHLLSNYLCFAPLPPNKPTNRQQASSSSHHASQSPRKCNTVLDSRLPPRDLCLHKKDRTTTRPCSSVCYEDDSRPGQVHKLCENRRHTHTPIICVTNFQDSPPFMHPEGERSLRAGDLYDECSIFLLEELKELCLWNQDCVMDEDDVNFMVSVMCKFRKLAFVGQVKFNHSYELASKSHKLKKLSEEKSGKYFSPSMSADANSAVVEFIDLDEYRLTEKKKFNEKRKESQVECEADSGSGSSKSANNEIIDLTQDIPSTEPISNAHHEAVLLGSKSSKRLGSFNVCYSRSIPKGRGGSLVDLVEVLSKKPKHSIDAD